MLEAFKNYVESEKLVNPNETILLGVSGGMDSMVMTHLFIQAAIPIAVAHCNYALRGKESDEDASFVREFAHKHTIPIHTRTFDTKARAEAHKESIQLAARNLRRQWFEELCLEHGYSRIATAHHLDDQNETFFINLLRGCGISGLHGILSQSGRYIHPLLFTGRDSIAAYARKQRIDYRDDRSNQQVKYLRNKIRHRILPELETLQPGFKTILQGNIERLRQVESIYRKHVEKIQSTFVKREAGQVLVDKKKLLSLEYAETYLYEFLSGYGFNASDAQQIFDSMTTGISGKIFPSTKHELLNDRDHLIIRPIKASHSSDTSWLIKTADKQVVSPIHLQIETGPVHEPFKVSQDPNVLVADYDALEFPLQIRKWRTGDSFYPLGMQQRKKLSDFFIDIKLTQFEKEDCWLLTSGDEVVWVIGYRLDDRFKISKHTANYLKIVYQPKKATT